MTKIKAKIVRVMRNISFQFLRSLVWFAKKCFICKRWKIYSCPLIFALCYSKWGRSKSQKTIMIKRGRPKCSQRPFAKSNIFAPWIAYGWYNIQVRWSILWGYYVRWVTWEGNTVQTGTLFTKDTVPWCTMYVWRCAPVRLNLPYS